MGSFFAAIFYCLAHYSYYVQSTEITVLSSITDKSLGLPLDLPILWCHARHTEYTKVTWYKDDLMLKNGTSDFSSHILSLATLLNASGLSEEFDNPFKLQGYYWCETDNTTASSILNYLFRMKEIHTFVGRFVAKEDSLGDGESLSQEEKISQKKELYEVEMQSTLFRFLPHPSVHVTDIKVLPKGLDVRFFLYIIPTIHPRKPIDEKLILDQDHLLYVQEYLLNETSATDPILYYTFRNWTDLQGIQIEEIELKSTLGCYEEQYPMSSNTQEEVVYPYARIGEVVIPDNACSSKNDLSVTRLCTGSFYQGATWGNPSGECEKTAQGVTLELKNIYNDFGNVKKIDTIETLFDATKDPSRLSITDLHLTIEILKALSLKPKLELKEISGMISIIDKLVETNETELIAAKNIIYLTSRVLRIFDNLLEQATNELKEIQISKNHLMVDTKFTRTEDEENPILGLAVIASSKSDTLSKGTIEFVKGNTKLQEHKNLAYFALPRELVFKRETDMEALKLPCQVNMIFFKEWNLFQNPKGVLVKRNYKVLPTPVMYVSISGGPEWNLTDPVHLYFKDTLDIEVEDPVCVYYDPRLDNNTGAWSSEGCEYEGYKNGYYHCQCHHLSIFAVILSQSPDKGHIQQNFKLGTSVYAASGVSMLALSLAVVLFVLSKFWRQTVDHSILFSLALCFLVCIIIIFISETKFAKRPGCMVFALVLHYTIFTIFGWLLVQAVVYRLRFAKKTDVGEIPHFMIKTGLAVWGTPIIIIVIMWFSREYSCAKKDNCWLAVAEVSKVAVIPMGVLMLITLCVYACATYALTGRFKKDFLIGDASYNDAVVKFRVAFTIFLFFVLTWLFGFFALQLHTQSLRILFSICITLTAYYVALFFIFQEISLWELCYKWKQNKIEPDDAAAIQYQSKTYKSVEESNKVEK